MATDLLYKTAIFVFCVILFGQTESCPRVPTEKHGPKRTGDNGYRLIIGEEPTGYVPGKIYNIFLLGARTHNNLQQFTHFTLNAQSASVADRSKAQLLNGSPRRVGRFQLFSDALTKFNEGCVNTISEADDLQKSEVQVMWVAPKKGSGCVALSAMVFESANEWYADDGRLTKIICEETPESRKATINSAECCACDEAKYSFVFEGIWSNETHPRDYPFAIWLTHFSDVIGASHDSNFSFWGEHHIATDGFRLMAEFGSVRLLETELRSKGSRLRTLVKAAGLWYPHVNTNTTSSFRADRIHHKLSLVSMFGPSPDWVVGINGLNLCNTDCSWADSFDIDLYPWDAGTDNGITYMSPNSETQPRERMYRITTMYPEDPRQPFYNPSSSAMTPLARLYIRKIKTIPQNCDMEFLQAQVLDVSENTEEGVTRAECEVTEFTEWTPCSVTCGKGIRMRTRKYRNDNLAASAQCNKQLVSKEMCAAPVAECEEAEDIDEDNLAKSSSTVNEAGEGVGVCKTTLWSEWAPCSATCGIGISMRTRTFIDYTGRKKCPHITIVEKEKCMKPECLASEMEVPDPLCPVTGWSDWSPCSATCGRGIVIRTRMLLNEGTQKDECSKRIVLFEQKTCEVRAECIFDANLSREICSLQPDVGPCRGVYNRYAYNNNTKSCELFEYGGCRGNQNNFLTINDCHQSCSSHNDNSVSHDSTVGNCILTEWTEWSKCSVHCGTGVMRRSRNIVQEARNGGEPCPKGRLLAQQKRCRRPAC